MKSVVLLSLVATVSLASAIANAEDLSAKHKCNICHDAQKKKMGPSWHDIAAKYKGTPDAEKHIAHTSISGSKGVWGKIPMPPQPKASDDAQALAKMILGN